MCLRCPNSNFLLDVELVLARPNSLQDSFLAGNTILMEIYQKKDWYFTGLLFATLSH